MIIVPRRANKHGTYAEPLSFADFTGGLRLDIPANSPRFQPNMLSKAVNVELDYVTGKLKVVDGLIPLVKLPAAAETLFYNYKDNYFLANCGRTLYKLSGFLSPNSEPVILGLLNGIRRPQYSVYGQYTAIVCGNRVQYLGYADTELTEVTSSPISSMCHVRGGRLHVANVGNPRITMCGANDITNWKIDNENEQDAWYADIAPGTGGIVAMRQLAGNIIVIKSSGMTYRFLSDHPSLFNAYDGPEGVYTVSQNGLLIAANNLYYVGQDGFNAMSFNSGEFGTLKTAAVGAGVNEELLRGVSQKACLWDVSPKKQIWVRADELGNTYLFHYSIGVWTMRKFSIPISDVCLVGNTVFVLAGDTIYKLDDTADTEVNGNPIQVDAAGKLYTSMDEFLIESIAATVDAKGTVNAKVSIGELELPIAYLAESKYLNDANEYLHEADYPLWTLTRTTPEQKRQVYRCKKFAFRLTSTQGAFALNEIKLQVAEV